MYNVHRVVSESQGRSSLPAPIPRYGPEMEVLEAKVKYIDLPVFLSSVNISHHLINFDTNKVEEGEKSTKFAYQNQLLDNKASSIRYVMQK